MTEPKFTPGPWYQGGGDYRHDVFDRKASRNPDGIREGETPNLIITVTSENVDADVKLIAAAPYLYSLLEGVSKFLEDNICLEQPFPDSPPEPASQFEYEAGLIVGEIQLLLAKARGESHD